MKLRILNYRANVTHDRISALYEMQEAVSISDFHAFVYDPTTLEVPPQMSMPVVQRRCAEISALIRQKGGIVICIMQPAAARDWLLGLAAPEMASIIRAGVREGTGSQFKTLSGIGVSGGYFETLKGVLHFTAHLEVSEGEISRMGGAIFAVDSVGSPIAVEFVVGEGRICFLPPAMNVQAERMGAAIAKVVTAHFQKTAQIDAPDWVEAIVVPGADKHDKQIVELTNRAEELTTQISCLSADRQKLLNHTRLLFGYGKAVLEVAVRSAFRLFGFTVPEPEDYEGEWDVELRDAQSGRTALGEVEGSEGVIDVDKYRQLLDYIDTEFQAGRDYKGILVGNGFRLLPPDAPKRRDQFSDHARKGAIRNHFCLLPTTELFKALCAVLESPEDEVLKAAIRGSLLSTTGVWHFEKQRNEELASGI